MDTDIMKLWICRDKYGRLTLHEERPFNNSGMWFSDNGSTHPYIRICQDSFPEVTFGNSPVEVELKLINLLS